MTPPRWATKLGARLSAPQRRVLLALAAGEPLVTGDQMRSLRVLRSRGLVGPRFWASTTETHLTPIGRQVAEALQPAPHGR